MKDSRFPLLLRSDVNIYAPHTRAADMYYIDHVIEPNHRSIEDIQFKMEKINTDIDKHKMDEHKMDKIDIDINELTMDVKIFEYKKEYLLPKDYIILNTIKERLKKLTNGNFIHN